MSAGGQWFVIPTASVERVARIPKELIRTVGAEDTVEFNGKAIPLVELRHILELPEDSVKREEIKFVPALMLRVGTDGRFLWRGCHFAGTRGFG